MKKFIVILALASTAAFANASEIVVDEAAQSFDCGYYDEFYVSFDQEANLDTSAPLAVVTSTVMNVSGYNWPYGWTDTGSGFSNVETESEHLGVDGFNWPYGI